MEPLPSSSSFSSPVIKQGWVQKRGEHIRNWRPRYFILKADGQFLGYKIKPSDDSNIDSLEPLNNFTVRNCEVLEFDRPPKLFGFSIRCMQMTAVVTRTFHVDSEEDRRSWVDAIMTVRNGLREEIGGAHGNNLGRNSSCERSKTTLECFEFIKVLGQGAFGKIILSRQKSSNQLYAIKILKKDEVMRMDEVAHTMAERNVLQRTKHPFLLQLKYAFTTADRLCLVTEYVNGGDLYFHLANERKFSEERARFYGAEIICAINYLHKLGIIYRDMKLENLLLDHEGHIKIADFGLCKEDIHFGCTTNTFCGTPQYLSPEIIEDDVYGRAVDWWGFGVVMYEMMVGRLPFFSSDQETMLSLIIGEEVRFPSGMTDEARELLSGLLVKDPSLRLGGGPEDAEEIMRHIFFESISWKDLEERKIDPPFKPQVMSDTDTRYFDAGFTGQSVELTPPEEEEENNFLSVTAVTPVARSFSQFSYQGSAGSLHSRNYDFPISTE